MKLLDALFEPNSARNRVAKDILLRCLPSSEKLTSEKTQAFFGNLAEKHKVGITNVRIVFSKLVDEGLITREKGGLYSLAENPIKKYEEEWMKLLTKGVID